MRKILKKTVYEYTAVFESDPDVGGYSVTIPALPGCISEGDTFEAALRNIHEAASLYLEVTPPTRAAVTQFPVLIALRSTGSASLLSSIGNPKPPWCLPDCVLPFCGVPDSEFRNLRFAICNLDLPALSVSAGVGLRPILRFFFGPPHFTRGQALAF